MNYCTLLDALRIHSRAAATEDEGEDHEPFACSSLQKRGYEAWICHDD